MQAYDDELKELQGVLIPVLLTAGFTKDGLPMLVTRAEQKASPSQAARRLRLLLISATSRSLSEHTKFSTRSTSPGICAVTSPCASSLSTKRVW